MRACSPGGVGEGARRSASPPHQAALASCRSKLRYPLPQGERRNASDQPQLLVGIPQRRRAFHRVAARHRQVEAFAAKDFGHRHHLQPIILAVEQRVPELARGGDLVAHRFGRQVHRDEEAELGLFALAVGIERGKTQVESSSL